MARAAAIAAAVLTLAGLAYTGAKAMETSRGIRNNNPGNIEKGADWVGLAEVQPEGRYAGFVAPEYGIRAMARILRTYREHYGLHTITDIISRWAPPSENPTDNYIAFVSGRMDHAAQFPLVFTDDQVADLIAAIIEFENGQQPYGRDVLIAGIQLERTA